MPPSPRRFGPRRGISDDRNVELACSPVAGAEEAKAGYHQEEREDGDGGTSQVALPPVESTTASQNAQVVDVRLAPRVLPAWADKVPQGITRNLPALLALATAAIPAAETTSSAPFIFGGLSLAAAAEGLKYYGEAHATQVQVRLTQAP